jgi:predicted ester cyclase
MKQFILLSVLGLLMLVVPSHSSYSQNNEAKNIEMVETYWTEVWSKGNLQAVADFYHPNAKHGEDFTIEGFQKSVSSLREAFPDFKVTIKDIFATENRVVSEVTFTGSHTGKKMFKQEPLGKTVSVPGIDIFTFKDGKCVNHQHVADHLDLVMQMGIQLTPTVLDKKN